MPEEAARRRLTLFRVLAGAYALFAAVAPLPRLPSVCLFRRVTGFRCPLCGLTQATRALTRGDLGQAVEMHPFAPLVWAVAALALTRRSETV
jgi:hypothetical protein